jgi:hypothetical protein
VMLEPMIAGNSGNLLKVCGKKNIQWEIWYGVLWTKLRSHMISYPEWLSHGRPLDCSVRIGDPGSHPYSKTVLKQSPLSVSEVGFPVPNVGQTVAITSMLACLLECHSNS